VQFVNFGGAAPADEVDFHNEYKANLKAVIDVLHQDQDLVDFLANRLVSSGESVPQ